MDSKPSEHMNPEFSVFNNSCGLGYAEILGSTGMGKTTLLIDLLKKTKKVYSND